MMADLYCDVLHDDVISLQLVDIGIRNFEVDDIGKSVLNVSFLSSFLHTDWFTMATDHQNPASKQQQPGASAFKVKAKTVLCHFLRASRL